MVHGSGNGSSHTIATATAAFNAPSPNMRAGAAPQRTPQGPPAPFHDQFHSRLPLQDNIHRQTQAPANREVDGCTSLALKDSRWQGGYSELEDSGISDTDSEDNDDEESEQDEGEDEDEDQDEDESEDEDQEEDEDEDDEEEDNDQAPSHVDVWARNVLQVHAHSYRRLC
jgi:hypothetical protein